MYQGHGVTQVNEMAQGPLYLNPFLAPICKVFIKYTKSSDDRQDKIQKTDSKLLAFLAYSTLRKRGKSWRWDVTTIDKSCGNIK